MLAVQLASNIRRQALGPADILIAATAVWQNLSEKVFGKKVVDISVTKMMRNLAFVWTDR